MYSSNFINKKIERHAAQAPALRERFHKSSIFNSKYSIDKMLIVDDILFFPMRSILWIFRELHNSVRQEMENEAESITAELSDLYMMLETERITEDEFDAREKQLLDRLEMIQECNTRIEDDEDPDPDKAEE
jgi:hypothetical protein